MDFLAAIAEQRICEAIARGGFDDLPCAGRPLCLDDDAGVPPELRMAYRVLKNAGLVPAEVLERKEIAAIEALLARIDEPAERSLAVGKLALLRARRRDVNHAGYALPLFDRLSRDKGLPK